MPDNPGEPTPGEGVLPEDTFEQRAEKLGHRLRRDDEDGEVDHFIMNSGFHNGPGCELCHKSWCEHCSGPDDIEPCDGGKAHADYIEKRDRAEWERLQGKYGTPPDEVTQKLIERLREIPRGQGHAFNSIGPGGEGCRTVVPYGNMMNEAASALATQAAEIGRLREWGQRESEAANKLLSESLALLERATKAERDLAEAQEALRRISGMNDLSGVPDDELEAAARSRLYECELIADEALASRETDDER